MPAHRNNIKANNKKDMSGIDKGIAINVKE